MKRLKKIFEKIGFFSVIFFSSTLTFSQVVGPNKREAAEKANELFGEILKFIHVVTSGIKGLTVLVVIIVLLISFLQSYKGQTVDFGAMLLNTMQACMIVGLIVFVENSVYFIYGIPMVGAIT